MTDAVLESMKEQGVTDEVNVERCNGTDACKRALLMLKMADSPATLSRAWLATAAV